jgi:hypothetical protein
MKVHHLRGYFGNEKLGVFDFDALPRRGDHIRIPMPLGQPDILYRVIFVEHVVTGDDPRHTRNDVYVSAVTAETIELPPMTDEEAAGLEDCESAEDEALRIEDIEDGKLYGGNQ